MNGPNLTRAFARNASESAYPNLWQGLVAAWAPPGAPRHATRLWDYSGNGNHGTIRNGANWTIGKNGHALNFDGTDDDVIGDTPGKNFPVGNQSRTVSCWIKAPSWTGDKGLLHWGHNGEFPAAANFHLVAGSAGNILWGNGFGDGILSGSINCADNRWHCITGIYSSSTNLATLYVDGRIDATDYLEQVPSTGSSDYWRIAKFLSNAGAWPGRIEGILLYNRLLLRSEILSIATGASPFYSMPSKILLKPKKQSQSFAYLVC
ncbi:MAG TPA: LamG-like jellyroll fold domain-containing protein [Verrucomicrobiae bacterium]